MDARLSKNILATVVYYDCLDYPVTAFEIWKNLIKVTSCGLEEKKKAGAAKKTSLREVLEALQETKLPKAICEHSGFYFLQGRQELCAERIKRNKLSMGKIKRLRRVVWFLRCVPFVRLIAMTGRLAMKNAQETSDWDLLVVLKSGRIWTGRTLVTAVTQLLGKRRYGKKITDRVCLNYFITDETLEITTKDLFSANEYFFIWPLFNTGLFRKFQLKNRWIVNFKPSYEISEVANRRIVPPGRFSTAIRRVGEWGLRGTVGEWVEKKLGEWQRKKIAHNPKTHLPGSFVQASDAALIFLPEPQGPEIFERFMQKISRLQD